jgi:hypothetical protein
MSKAKWDRDEVPIRVTRSRRFVFTATDKEEFDKAYQEFWRVRGLPVPSGEFPDFGKKTEMNKEDHRCG